MTRAEWESLCDGCARCCLVKLEYEDTGAIEFTNIGCRLLDLSSCRCTDYANRRRHVSDCIRLTPARVRSLKWLPPTCAYRLVDEGRDLYWWHHLLSGDPGLVHKVGVSVRGRVVAEPQAGPPERHIVRWPARVPRGATGGAAPVGPQASDRAPARPPSRTAPDDPIGSSG
ncbi:MAG: YcgN family cysteine cluster protein [Rhodospirillaceae bacterium]|nr:YcgN family cysteine cluster protein [Rhodospirillaceae bacterium]